jgi:hypothetical protein
MGTDPEPVLDVFGDSVRVSVRDSATREMRPPEPVPVPVPVPVPEPVTVPRGRRPRSPSETCRRALVPACPLSGPKGLRSPWQGPLAAPFGVMPLPMFCAGGGTAGTRSVTESGRGHGVGHGRGRFRNSAPASASEKTTTLGGVGFQPAQRPLAFGEPATRRAGCPLQRQRPRQHQRQGQRHSRDAPSRARARARARARCVWGQHQRPQLLALVAFPSPIQRLSQRARISVAATPTAGSTSRGPRCRPAEGRRWPDVPWRTPPPTTPDPRSPPRPWSPPARRRPAPAAR